MEQKQNHRKAGISRVKPIHTALDIVWGIARWRLERFE